MTACGPQVHLQVRDDLDTSRQGSLDRPVLRSGDDEVLGDDDHFIIPRRVSSPAGDDRGMIIHFCVILYHPPVSSPRESVAIDYHPPVSSPEIINTYH